MSISALTNGLSGMQSYQRALDVSANNVANAQTNGFQPQTANFKENAPAGNGVTVSASAPTTVTSSTTSLAASGTDLANETVNQLTYKFGFDMSAKVVQTADQMLGTLIDTRA